MTSRKNLARWDSLDVRVCRVVRWIADDVSRSTMISFPMTGVGEIIIALNPGLNPPDEHATERRASEGVETTSAPIPSVRGLCLLLIGVTLMSRPLRCMGSLIWMCFFVVDGCGRFIGSH
jgi:hypothetical protein